MRFIGPWLGVLIIQLFDGGLLLSQDGGEKRSSETSADYRVTLTAESRSMLEDDDPAVHSSRLVYDFRVTQRDDERTFQLLSHRKAVSVNGVTRAREFSREGVSATENGETVEHDFDDLGPGLQKILVDLFEHPLATSRQSDEGLLMLETSDREKAQTEIKHGTPLLLSFAPTLHSSLRALPEDPDSKGGHVLMRSLVVEPAIGMHVDFVLVVTPERGDGKAIRYSIEGRGSVRVPGLPNPQGEVDVSPVRGTLSYDGATGRLKACSLACSLKAERETASNESKIELEVISLNRTED